MRYPCIISKRLLFLNVDSKQHIMSKEQIKKDLTMQLGVVKMKLKQLVFIEEQTGIRRTEEINALLDRLNLIEKILKEMENE